METVDKRCGNCGWWKRFEPEFMYGDCDAPLPDTLPIAYKYTKIATYKYEGSDCPCHKPKEEGK